MIHAVEKMKPFLIQPQQLGSEIQWLAAIHLAVIINMRLYRVERVTPGAVIFVDAHITKERSRGVAESREITRLGHMAIVVNPDGIYCAIV
jgi:hypothetical protein